VYLPDAKYGDERGGLRALRCRVTPLPSIDPCARCTGKASEIVRHLAFRRVRRRRKLMPLIAAVPPDLCVRRALAVPPGIPFLALR